MKIAGFCQRSESCVQLVNCFSLPLFRLANFISRRSNFVLVWSRSWMNVPMFRTHLLHLLHSLNLLPLSFFLIFSCSYFFLFSFLLKNVVGFVSYKIKECVLLCIVMHIESALHIFKLVNRFSPTNTGWLLWTGIGWKFGKAIPRDLIRWSVFTRHQFRCLAPSRLLCLAPDQQVVTPYHG